LAAEIPFARAAKVFERLTYMPLSGSSLQRLVQEYGGQVVDLQAAEATAMVKPPPKFDEGPFRLVPEPDSKVMAVSMDGAMVHVRGEGWKKSRRLRCQRWNGQLRRTPPWLRTSPRCS
jgi:hypothetical protein